MSAGAKKHYTYYIYISRVFKLILNMKNCPEKMCDQTLLLVPVAYSGTYRNHFMSHI